MNKEFLQMDAILPKLQLPSPCQVKVKLTDKHLFLYIGSRDWQWDLASGELVGCGTVLPQGVPLADE